MTARPKLTLTSITQPQPGPGLASADVAPARPEPVSARALEPRPAAAPAPAAPQRDNGEAPTQVANEVSAEGVGSGRERPAEPWRQWGPFSYSVGFKWPAELVDELDDRRHDLREPIGLMVVAAVTHLLDQEDDVIHRLIDRAEDAKPRIGHRRRADR